MVENSYSDIGKDVCATQKDPADSAPAESRACDRFGRNFNSGAGALGLLHFTRWQAGQQSPFRLESVSMCAEMGASQIKAWALAEGFDRAGIAWVRPSDNGPALLEWLERGDHAAMQYLERRQEIRLNPQGILAGVKSVLCVALQYHPLSGGDSPGGDLWPGVARYARGQDYHDFMLQGLGRVAQRVQEAYPSAHTKSYVDTGPVLERELAARAGLGSVGKNTNLLDAEIGSWFLLGELFLTLELASDVPGSDLCGSCSHCLEACPTGALPEPYRLDSRLCISYWTIEHRGTIPPNIRPMLGNWVFGCDICQEVCPVNTDLPPASHEELCLSAEKGNLDLIGLLGLNRDKYTELFRGSPMKRAKLEGLQRNAALAMGNSRSPKYVESLMTAVIGAEAGVRRHAAWALGRIGNEKARRALREALETETDGEIRVEIEDALLFAGNQDCGLTLSRDVPILPSPGSSDT